MNKPKTDPVRRKSNNSNEEILVLGLGPGDWHLVTVEARETLSAAKEIYLRTARHPAVRSLPAHLQVRSFDSIYEESATFDEVYQKIASILVEVAQESPSPVLYAVPGHPLVGETSVRRLLTLAREKSLAVRIIPGLSFLDAVFATLQLDPLQAGIGVLDALEVAAVPAGEGAGEKTQWLPLSQRLDPTQPLLICQLYNRRTASGVKLALLEIYPADHAVTIVQAAGVKGEESVKVRPLSELDHSDDLDHLTCLYVPPLPIQEALCRFEALEYIVARLRGPGGCPWDREQTHQSLKGHLIEETYEVLEALDSGRPDKVAEEFGDLLLQIVLHTQIASEADDFAMSDVLSGISSKLIRRHPHVFGEIAVSGSAEVLRNWEQIKRAERLASSDEEEGEKPTSILSSLPASMPALAYAQGIQQRAARVGFDWRTIEPVLDKVSDEVSELSRAANQVERMTEFGDILFSLVNVARWLKIDAEEALRLANRRFRERFQLMEEMAGKRQVEMRKLSLDQLDELWEEAKRRLVLPEA
ncbi:MAG: nucleoside triphosphate pyrophosphohydrolase [Chloroflexi bacterium]|nr:nucleoside triphosphate pyrophosphohydrolase [Chloroflexota bacterium]